MKYLLKNSIRPLYHYLKNKSEREFQRLHDKYAKKPRYTLHKNVNFLSYQCDIPDLASFIWQFKEIFVDDIYFFKTQNTNPIIFDCGANIGLSCLYFKKMYPDSVITAFEADPQIAEVLQENITKNKLHEINVISKAVWIDEQGVSFQADGADGGSIMEQSHVDKKIESIRLKDYLEKTPYVDLLKIDIEGAEVEVLSDCKDSLRHVSNMFVEYHAWQHEQQSLATLLDILQTSGFRYYIENIAHRNKPFVNHGQSLTMDLQLNIFAYRR